jgi:hypothetical protein
MAEPTYDPYAYSDIGSRALGGEYIDAMNFFWFDPVTGEEGQTTEGWSRVPDAAKPYTYLDPGSRNQARNTFYESGAAFGGAGGTSGMGGLLSGQAYAQQIAGGMPFEQVVAPGMSFSPDQPMGYIAEGATPFQPRPTFFPSAEDPSVGMTGEDLGLPMGAGTPMPAGTTFEGEPIRMPAPSVMGSPLPLDINIDELLKNIDVEQAVENLPIPEPMAAPTVSAPMIPPVIEAPTPIMDVPMNLGFPMIQDMPPTSPVLNIDNIVSPIRQGSPRALLGTL